jgi:UDP-GlcNAc:undecaprenyl-phosphate/decaprenyl-phosphate GlcNAc-1-phosphate transferase
LSPALSFAAAAVVTAFAAVVVRALARRTGLVDPPNPRVPLHTKPVATLGGLAVATGCLVALAAGAEGGVEPGLAVGAALSLGAGIADDVRRLPIAAKLALQTLAAGVAVALGLELDLTGNALVDAVAAVVWILVVVNAVNLTDVCDGLVPGIAAIAFLALAAVEPGASGLAAAAAGACVGFLALNAPPASIFLGDAGSHLIGFLLAAFALESAAASGGTAGALAVVLVLAVFLFELVFVVVERARRGLPWWLASDDHVALRLQAAGLGAVRTDLVLWTCATAFALAGLLASRLEGFALLAVALVAVAAAAAAGGLLHVLARPTSMRLAVRAAPSRPHRA